MQIHVIPIDQGMNKDELAGRIQAGWIKVGRQMINTGTQLATLNQPGGPALVDCDVWALPEPTVPVGVVAGALMQSLAANGNLDTLNLVSTALFNLTVPQLAEKFGIPGSAAEKLPEDMPIM